MAPASSELALFRDGLVEGAFRLAWVVSRWVTPDTLRVGTAAVTAALLLVLLWRSLHAQRRRPALHARRRASGTALVIAGTLLCPIATTGVSAEVVCRKAHSSRLVLRPDACRRGERALDPAVLGVGPAGTCIETIVTMRDALADVRVRLEAAHALAERLAAQPWEGGELHLVLQAIGIRATLADVERQVAQLGAVDASAAAADLARVLERASASPGEACVAALSMLPALEAAMPSPGAPYEPVQ
jgi:hypothetical protein